MYGKSRKCILIYISFIIQCTCTVHHTSRHVYHNEITVRELITLSVFHIGVYIVCVNFVKHKLVFINSYSDRSVSQLHFCREEVENISTNQRQEGQVCRWICLQNINICRGCCSEYMYLILVKFSQKSVKQFWRSQKYSN